MKIAQGAEAVISKEKEFLVKERVKKNYRIQKIDESLRSKRTRLESRLLREARRAGVAAPQIFEEDKFSIRMEFVDGNRVKEILNKKNFRGVAEEIGRTVAQLHTYGIIHGDLTTSNMILKGDKLYFIDFGLGFFSRRTEDKATDLHLLREALESTHFDVMKKMWTLTLDAYKKNYAEAGSVIKTLSKIEKRGRYVERGKR